ncbi:unnamed protein product [Didymodactylos carnosus]|uniref:Uncharacterized protein n=1 Tax=Didymodactylos carnosus TaxID=1234261 RepID=A0A813ZDY1_9BILA|nr:unnamed protein product [Didymodactylos carnosus]CAF0944031.1 unnamed protein product [Didymodactylos carnosus]CAF3680188.1 unnamed protein product [Didymodactylos carnosus]CAF3718766.1 unnamed protein product [Didymodactylos carnosus]
MAEKKKKKGGGKKSKKGGENVYEALLAYKIGVIDKELEEWHYKINQIEEDNEQLNGRDAVLREECAMSMKTLVTNAVQFDKENIIYPTVRKEDVHAMLHKKIEAANREEAEIKEIHDQMFHVEVEIFKVRSQIKHWLKYRDYTRGDELKAIQALERELAYMIDNYAVLSKYLEKTTTNERSQITKLTEDKIEQKTKAVTERVAMGLDRYTKKMMSENEYMNREIATRKREIHELEVQLLDLEQKNIDMSEKLNIAHRTDTITYTNTFMTEFNDDMIKNFERNLLLEVDLGQLTLRKEEDQYAFTKVLDDLLEYTPRLTGDDDDTIVSPMATLCLEGTRMHVFSPPKLTEEEDKCLEFKPPTWIDTPHIKKALSRITV